MSKSMHWYDRDGKAVFEVPKAKGDGMRATTIADARKLNLYPSVTTVLSVIAKPAGLLQPAAGWRGHRHLQPADHQRCV